jgi:hypothetical protein
VRSWLTGFAKTHGWRLVGLAVAGSLGAYALHRGWDGFMVAAAICAALYILWRR